MTLPHHVADELFSLLDQLDRVGTMSPGVQDIELTRIERRIDQITRAYPGPAAERGYELAPRFTDVPAPSSSRASYQTALGTRRGGFW